MRSSPSYGASSAAVEEEGHMGVLLGLGDAQLGLTLLGKILAKDVLQALPAKGHMHVRHVPSVLGHADIIGPECGHRGGQSR